jgi:alpha-ribazole phosphatase/probable phosphoglycerate mutase
MEATRVVLVRHGHSPGNVADGAAPMCGGSTDLPLTERGRREAVRFGARLAAEDERYAVYTSSSRRAVETARLATPRGLLCSLDELREIDCGMVDGYPIDQVRVDHPELWAANLRQDDPRFRWPGGESYAEFRRRCVAAVDNLARCHAGERILIVTHAGVISQLVGAIHGISPARWAPFRPGNCSVTSIAWGSDRREVLSFDDRSHLS